MSGFFPWRRHPDAADFTRFVDGEASADEARIIEDHVAGCPRCQENLEFFREVAAAAQKLTHPAPPAGLFEEILSRREAGERMILPTAPPPPEEENGERTPVSVVFLVLLALGLATLFFHSGEAAAGASRLHVLPELPRAGEHLRLEFHAASRLASESRLRLRGWYRTPGESPPREQLGTYVEGQLERRGAGRFRGEVWLPPRAVYATFAVEDLEGVRVENNGHRLWEILAHDEAGRPLFAALRQKLMVEEFRQSPDVLETARRLTTLYPEHPDGWRFRLFYEELFSPELADSIRAFHSGALERLDHTLWVDPSVTADAMAALARYADRLDEPETARRWEERLLAEYPKHPAAVKARVLNLLRRFAAHPGALLTALDMEWTRSGPAAEFLAERGFDAALRAENPEAIERWAARYRSFRPDLTGFIAKRLAEVPALRERAAELIREALGNLESSARAYRRPTFNRDEHERENRERARRLLGTLGSILAAQGENAAALDTLARAAADGWDPELFRDMAHTRLAVGDTAGALELASRVTVDPLEDEDPIAVLGLRAAGWLDAERLSPLLDDARRELERRVLEEAAERPLPDQVAVRGDDGAIRPLRALLRRPATLVLYCAPISFLCDRDLPKLASAARLLREAGAGVVLVIGQEKEARAGLSWPREIDLPPVVDFRGDVAHALDNWQALQYAVLDEDGRIRFHHGNLEKALRQVIILARRSSLAA